MQPVYLAVREYEQFAGLPWKRSKAKPPASPEPPAEPSAPPSETQTLKMQVEELLKKENTEAAVQEYVQLMSSNPDPAALPDQQALPDPARLPDPGEAEMIEAKTELIERASYKWRTDADEFEDRLKLYQDINNIKDRQGRTLLMIAIAAEAHRNVQVLLKHGVNVNDTDKHGQTALQIAAKKANLTIYNALLDAGATLFGNRRLKVIFYDFNSEDYEPRKNESGYFTGGKFNTEGFGFTFAVDRRPIISEVDPEKPAYKAGLRVGDMISTWNSNYADKIERLVRVKDVDGAVILEIYKPQFIDFSSDSKMGFDYDPTTNKITKVQEHSQAFNKLNTGDKVVLWGGEYLPSGTWGDEAHESITKTKNTAITLGVHPEDRI